MSVPRALLLIGAIAVVAIAGLVIRNGLRHQWLLSAVGRGDHVAARRVLERQPGLVTMQVMPQGSASTSGRIRWQGRTLMHLAVQAGSVETAETLAAFGADLDVRINGDTLLHQAAEAGDLPMMTWLVEKGLDVNARNGCEHPANAVCTSGGSIDLQPSARPETSRASCPGCAYDGWTPLHAAQRFKADAGSALLLSRGADAHAVDALGRTPLHIAAAANSGDGARVLCAYGADSARRDSAGKTPEDVARAADLVNPDRFSQTGPGELAGWLRPGGGCTQVAARARPGMSVPIEEVNEAWRAYACTRDAKWCANAAP